METVNNTELGDESIYPDDKVLRIVLGKSYDSYSLLLKLFNRNEMTYDWRYYRDGKAWLCKVQKKKRTVVWMSAWKGFMQATVYFPQKYLKRVYNLDILGELKRRFRSTKDVGNSKPCIFQIRNKKTILDLEKVMLLKIECK